jgi:hypothetical protein
VVFTLADAPLETFLKTRQRSTAGNQAKYAWNVTIGICGYISRIFHCWCLEGGARVSLNARLKPFHDQLDPEVQAALGLDTEHWARCVAWPRYARFPAWCIPLSLSHCVRAFAQPGVDSFRMESVPGFGWTLMVLTECR